MIKILKASAGSGKTYTLANEYIALLTEKYAYRHILAVTFTNKATAEMKARILKFLSESHDAKDREMLRDILHDYSAFAVSTIDKFFQQALKSFAREIGQVADYQIDLDKKSLVHEAMDSILDSLTREDSDTLEWLQQSINEELRQGRRIHIEDTLYEMGERLTMPDCGPTDELRRRFSKENLAAIRKNCDEIISAFTNELNAAAKDVQVVKANSIKQLAPYLEGYKTWEKIPLPKTTLMKEAEGSRFCELLSGDRYRWYCTAWMLRDMSFSLGLAGEFYRSFQDLLREKNVMILDESNVILKDIIAGSDAPFVYEKMGVRYENFLLDEFQDTSNIQWENFRPLLRESEANEHNSLIVGDVKQSIYRWRDSDWTLLARRVKEDFPRSSEDTLQNNWRSLKTIVNFNNAFFEFAARAINQPDLYSDVRQNVKSDDTQEGMVRVSFCEKDGQIPMVLNSIGEARAAGANYSDIAVLVRANSDGAEIARELMKEGIPVVSDDSLKLKSSKTLRKLAGILANHENPDDRINSYLAEAESVVFPEQYHSLTDLCENLLLQLREKSPSDFDGETLFIQAFMDDLREWTEVNGNDLKNYLGHWEEGKQTISSPAGTDAVRVITVHKAKGLEFPYLIFPYAHKVDFYKAGWKWCPLNTEGSPFTAEAQGLYPVMLDSNADNTLFADSLLAEKKMQLVDNINVFYVALTRAEKCLHVIADQPSKAFIASLGKVPDYKDFSQVLYHFCGCVDEYQAGSMYDFKTAGRDCPSSTVSLRSTPPIAGDGPLERLELRGPRKLQIFGESLPRVAVVSEGQSLPAAPEQNLLKYSYRSIPIGDRLKVSADASDFFGEDGATGPAASPRRNGIALHGILSKVQTPEDLRPAVDDAVLEGTLTEDEAREAFALLQERIAAHPGWFAGGGMNEITVFDVFGNGRRPDRVAPDGDGIVIIDYKFGESTPESDARYSGQVSGYMKIFRSLGYGKVSGVVWYVVPDKMITL